MSRLDDLPPDQRAVLLLLVQQGKSHAEIADMLGIPLDSVRGRAHAALSALADGPLAEDAPAESSGAPRAPTRGARGARETRGTRDTATTPSSSRPSSAPAEAAPVHPVQPSTTTSLPVSRRGGALLLAALLAAVVVAVVLITSGGGSHHGTGAVAGAGTQTSSTSTKAAASPTVDSQFALTPIEPSSKAIGFVEVLSEKGEHAFYIGAEHLPPSTGFSYVVWLYNSPSSHEALVKGPTVGSNGRLAGGALLPANAGEYHKMLLTRETSDRPTHPGTIVLSGSFSLGH